MPVMVETLPDVSASVSKSAHRVSAKRTYEWLRPYQFKKGDPNNPRLVNPRAARQRGTPNAQTIYLESLPVKARQWVKSTAPAILVDARKIALPIDSDTSASPSLNSGPTVIVFLQEGQSMPLIPVAADGSASEIPRIASPIPDDQPISSDDE